MVVFKALICKNSRKFSLEILLIHEIGKSETSRFGQQEHQYVHILLRKESKALLYLSFSSSHQHNQITSGTPHKVQPWALSPLWLPELRHVFGLRVFTAFFSTAPTRRTTREETPNLKLVQGGSRVREEWNPIYYRQRDFKVFIWWLKCP